MNIVVLAESLKATDQISVGDGALYAILAIVMVFCILLIIIGVTSLIFKELGYFELKNKLDSQNAKPSQNNQVVQKNNNEPVIIEDDDMMAAVLVATIDYRNEIKKDVRVVSIKEVK